MSRLMADRYVLFGKVEETKWDVEPVCVAETLLWSMISGLWHSYSGVGWVRRYHVLARGVIGLLTPAGCPYSHAFPQQAKSVVYSMVSARSSFST